MPAYISHSIMAENIYNDNKNDDKIFRVSLSVDSFKTYSLGADLAALSNHLNSNPHLSNTRDFYLAMINYIKENNLCDNNEIIALLYGHIAHYFLDISTHPFIFYLDKGCKNVGLVSNHRLIEGFLDSYLTDKILKKDIMQIDENYFNKANLNNTEVKTLLNAIYGNIYGDMNIIKTYKKTLYLFSLIEKIVKSGLFSKEDLIKIVKFKDFLEINHLSPEELTNENKEIYTNPCSGERSNLSFLEMYRLAIIKTLTAIYEVNKYLYDGTSFDNLYKVFTNLSYDTALPCGEKKEFIYVRKFKNR